MDYFVLCRLEKDKTCYDYDVHERITIETHSCRWANRSKSQAKQLFVYLLTPVRSIFVLKKPSRGCWRSRFTCVHASTLCALLHVAAAPGRNQKQSILRKKDVRKKEARKNERLLRSRECALNWRQSPSNSCQWRTTLTEKIHANTHCLTSGMPGKRQGPSNLLETGWNYNSFSDIVLRKKPANFVPAVKTLQPSVTSWQDCILKMAFLQHL